MIKPVIGGALLAFTLPAQVTRPALPLAFERNAGQTDTAVLFSSRGPGYRIFFTAAGVTLSSPNGAIRMQLKDANPNPEVRGGDLLEGVANYLAGDSGGWHTGIPLYGKVIYRNIYPGIDLVFHGNDGQMEYDLILGPRVSPETIKIAFDGIEGLHVEEKGDLILRTEGGEVRHRRPLIYQERRGRKVEISGKYVVHGPREVGFELGSYDRSQQLIIDPVLVYSTYLGGSASDSAWGLAVDSSGAAYIVGESWSGNFPRTISFGATGGNQEAFVVKLNPAGTGIVYATYFGGGNRDSARAVTLDAAGNVYIAGFTSSNNFPVTAGAHRIFPAGQEDAFVLKLAPTGIPVYSTRVGAGGGDFATGIAIDASGNAYVSGYTSSVGFPTSAGAAQPGFAGGMHDAFVFKLNASGSALVYASYLGGEGNDLANGIALDGGGFAHVVGFTDSGNLPVRNALWSTPVGDGDAFVAKLNPVGDAFAYLTYAGGSSRDRGNAIALDSQGNTHIAGATFSRNFPVTAGAFQPVLGGDYDAFLMKLNPSGSALISSTYLGGSNAEAANAIAVDSSGKAYIAGFTASTNFPSQGAGSMRFAGLRDAFVAVFSNSALTWSTCLGGAGDDLASAVAAAAPNSVYVTGTTASGFPVTPAAYGRVPSGGMDAFVAQVSLNGAPMATRVPSVGWMQVPSRQTVIWTMTGPEGSTKESWGWLEQQGLPGWLLVSMSDFDQDGVADALWMHEQTRQAVVRYRAAPGTWAWLSADGLPGWTLVTSGHFNYDSVPDLVWMHDKTRKVLVWYMSIVQGKPLRQAWAWISEAGVPGWKIAAAADFNRDGSSDLVWLNDVSRQAVIWYMGGAAGNIPQFWNWLSSSAVPGWRITGAGDFDQDGTPDVTWMEESSGRAVVWFLDSANGAPRAWAWLNSISLPGWQLVVAP
jgi:hypothetical protein